MYNELIAYILLLFIKIVWLMQIMIVTNFLFCDSHFDSGQQQALLKKKWIGVFFGKELGK